MATSTKPYDKQGASTNLLGQQDYPFNPYPLTSPQVRFEIERDSAKASHEARREIATMEAAAAAESEAEQAQEEARFRIDGSVVLPKWKTLGGFKAMLYRSQQKSSKKDAPVWDVSFSPQNYGAFDAIIAKEIGLDFAAVNPKSPDYQEYAALRRNIALLRGVLMGYMFPDGEFIPNAHSAEGREDKARYDMLNMMAEKLGKALHTPRQSAFQRLLKGEPLASSAANDFMKAANIPDKGAIVMYKYLEGLHETPTFRDIYTKNTPLNWTLPPRSETPFSDDNYKLHGRVARLQGAADAYEQIIMEPMRGPPENMTPEDCNTSVQLAREILERLKKLLDSKPNRDEMAQFADEKQEEATKLLKVADSFREAIARIEDTRYEDNGENPAMRIPKPDADPEADTSRNKMFIEAREALEVLGYRLKVDAYKAMVTDKEFAAADDMRVEIERTPDKYKTDVSTDVLLDKVETGLKEADRVQRQTKIAQAIAQKEAQRAARRAQREGNSQQFANNMANRLKRTYMSRRQETTIRKASEPGAAAMDMRSAMEKVNGQGGINFDTGSMAGATVTGVNEGALPHVKDLQRERETALTPHQSSQSR